MIRSLKNVLEETAGVTRRLEFQNLLTAKLKINFFVWLRVASLVLQLILLVREVFTVERTKWIQDVIGARLDTCLRLSSIDEVVSHRCKLRETGE